MKTLPKTSTPPDVGKVFELPDPVLSAYLGSIAPTHEYSVADVRGTVMRTATRGASSRAVDVLRQIVEAVPADFEGSAVFIGADGTLAEFPMPGLHIADRIVSSTVPHLTPLLAWWQARPAHVVAVVDRAGADITVFPAGADDSLTTTVTGPDDEIVRNAPGGWSQLRHQHRAEDSWKHNAGRSAEAAAAALERSDARLLLLAGDVRAVQYFTAQLPAWVRNQVEIRTVSGSRSEDGAAELRRRQVQIETAEAGRRRDREFLKEFGDRSGQNGRSVEGVSATLRALARGQVDTLLVTDREDDAARVGWFGPAATDIALHIAGLSPNSHNAVEPKRGPLTDVAVRSALLGDAEVRVLDPETPGMPYHGIGALCRFP